MVLVSIDFENLGTIKSGFAQKENCQIGLAILDTKEINRMPPDKVISTHNFATGPPSYLSKASRKFMFGETIAISPSNIVNHIQSSIPSDRNVVFVGHSIINDLQALQALDFEYSVLLSSILDTFYVANEVLGCWGGSLGDLLLSLGCSFNRLHSAGNDANFTLRALLLLAARGFSKQQGEEGEDRDTLAYLTQISTSPIPHWVDPEVQAMQKREKRLAKSRKHQSKTWSKEKQEEIRAARQLKNKRNIDNLKRNEWLLQILQ